MSDQPTYAASSLPTLAAVPGIPHIRVVVWFCLIAIGVYGAFCVWALIYGDPATKGDVLGTWKSFAVLAFGFWLGSSSGGKTRDPVATDPTTGGPMPTPVQVMNKKNDAVPTTPGAEAEPDVAPPAIVGGAGNPDQPMEP